MNDSTGAQLSSGRRLLPLALVTATLIGISEWAVDTWVPQSSAPLGLTIRIAFVTLLLVTLWHYLLRRQRKLNRQLTQLLQYQEKLNARYQRELLEREATEVALSDQLHFLQVLTDAIPAPIFYKDAKGIYTGCNRAFEAFLGKPRSEIIGRSVFGVSPGPQAKIYHEKDLELMRQRGHQVYESQVVYADGTLHDVVFNKGAYTLEDGRLGGLIGVILDITDRKNLERDLLAAKDKAEFFSRSKTRFLTNMSHEIRTPLNAIVGFSQVLQSRSQGVELPQDFHSFLEKISISGQRLAELVNDVLDISRIEAGKIEAVNEHFPLQRLVQCILVSCEPEAIRQGVRIHSDIDPALPEYIECDRGKLSQILINLIANAIKFSPANSTVELRLRALNGTQLVIEVTDRGIGITPEQQAIIFEPFEQVDKSHLGQTRGTGLGLPITRSLVELLGGEISLRSDGSTGTRFTVVLPLRRGNPEPPQALAGEFPCARLAGKQVLVFEDNPLNQTLMQAFCDDLELCATFVADGRDGIDKARTLRPDLIFMDVQLPGLTGIEATRQIRKDPVIGETPIIGLSAAAFSDQQNAAMDAGMNAYLTKPIAFPQLIATIKSHLPQSE
ncbi:ATP-binding protein [Microbulbifer elongatus]|uniref:ATP-binding protein n=1 Tax=Microbulbifer elongatus TaxID=86173 RepID=UPI001F4A752B|nr:ATP-binding protein [Microbulbifer elongatus]